MRCICVVHCLRCWTRPPLVDERSGIGTYAAFLCCWLAGFVILRSMMGGWVGPLGLGMRGLTSHAEAGRQQWKCALRRSKGEARTLYKYLIRQTSQPASVVQTYSKKKSLAHLNCM